MATDGSFGERLESQTESYLGRLDDCVSLLPSALDAYEETGSCQDLAAEIAEIESDCDSRVRALTGAITNAGADDIGLLNTRINFNQSALIELYNQLDVVANHTERIVNELGMMRPAAAVEPFACMRSMAAHIVDMVDTLVDVTSEFVRGLTRSDLTRELTAGIERIRELESECDDLRDEAIATAFADDTIDSPLVYRALAILFDELANTIEDLTDQLIVIGSEEPRIITETDPAAGGR